MKYTNLIKSIAVLFFSLCTPIFILILCGEQQYNSFTQQWELPLENVARILLFIIFASVLTILGTIIFEGLKK